MKLIVPCVTLIALFLLMPNAYPKDSAALRALFDEAEEHSTVTVPPGDHYLDDAVPIKLRSNLMVHAYGARFHLPETLEDRARLVLFEGENISNLRWHGGHFVGHVFDPNSAQNTWPPNANTRFGRKSTTKRSERWRRGTFATI
jgi:hypothetical protein